MKKIIVIILSALSISAHAVPSAWDIVTDSISCTEYIVKYAVNTKRNMRLLRPAAQYICQSSRSKANAAACAVNLYAYNWIAKNGVELSSNDIGTMYACSHADSTRARCVDNGKRYRYYPAEISSACNAQKALAISEVQ